LLHLLLFHHKELPEVKSAPPPLASADGDVIVNVVDDGTVIT